MEPGNRDHFDSLIDQGLREYGIVEPRAGLEGRVLANLAAQNRFASNRRWVPVFALAAGIGSVSLIVGVVATQHHPGKAIGGTPAALVVASPDSTDPARETSAREKRRTKSVRRRIEVSAETAMEKPFPRLSQFPSQRPLSAQEELLVRYVRESPGEAVLVARAQAEREKQFTKLMESESLNAGSDQQER